MIWLEVELHGQSWSSFSKKNTKIESILNSWWTLKAFVLWFGKKKGSIFRFSLVLSVFNKRKSSQNTEFVTLWIHFYRTFVTEPLNESDYFSSAVGELCLWNFEKLFLRKKKNLFYFCSVCGEMSAAGWKVFSIAPKRRTRTSFCVLIKLFFKRGTFFETKSQEKTFWVQKKCNKKRTQFNEGELLIKSHSWSTMKMIPVLPYYKFCRPLNNA